jgi:hypothetical protein
LGFKLAGKAQFILDSNGILLAEVKEIIQLTKEYNIVLATGHISPKEIFKLNDEARKIGFNKLVITHALQGVLMETALNLDEIKQLAQSGAYIEHSFWDWMPTMSNLDPQLIIAAIRATGAEQCIMSTDMGQIYNPPAPEGFRLFIATMLRKGLSEKEIELMVKTNPSKLLDLAHPLTQS